MCDKECRREGTIGIMFPWIARVNAQKCSSPSHPSLDLQLFRGHMLCARNKMQLLKDMKQLTAAILRLWGKVQACGTHRKMYLITEWPIKPWNVDFSFSSCNNEFQTKEVPFLPVPFPFSPAVHPCDKWQFIISHFLSQLPEIKQLDERLPASLALSSISPPGCQRSAPHLPAPRLDSRGSWRVRRHCRLLWPDRYL